MDKDQSYGLPAGYSKERLLKVMRCLIDTADRTTDLNHVYNDGWDGDFDDQGYPIGRDPAREYENIRDLLAYCKQQESVTWSEVEATYTALCYALADEKFLAAHPHK